MTVEKRVWKIEVKRHERGHLTEYVDGPITDGLIEVVPAEAIERLIESEGWGDDAADDWWKDQLRGVLDRGGE